MTRLASDMQLMFRRPPKQQYGALCYRLSNKRGLEILLMTSRETKRWVIPKGWPMPGKQSPDVAAQEAYEEAGVQGAVEDQPLGSFRYMKTLKDGLKVECRVQVYALAVSAMVRNFKEKGERKLEWVSCQEAARRVKETELRDIILAFEAARAGA